mmetsp:Transcript_57019/g.118267  ORF Transcript_57019/g.118267 Transcript_57019/m.118267 type:complete len:192 (+) Transcript_57019:76-651(+)
MEKLSRPADVESAGSQSTAEACTGISHQWSESTARGFQMEGSLKTALAEHGTPYVVFLGDDTSSCGSFWNPFVDDDSDLDSVSPDAEAVSDRLQVYKTRDLSASNRPEAGSRVPPAATPSWDRRAQGTRSTSCSTSMAGSSYMGTFPSSTPLVFPMGGQQSDHSSYRTQPVPMPGQPQWPVMGGYIRPVHL